MLTLLLCLYGVWIIPLFFVPGCCVSRPIARRWRAQTEKMPSRPGVAFG